MAATALQLDSLSAFALESQGQGHGQTPEPTPERVDPATYRDVAIRYLCANTHPDRDTICDFRRRNFTAVTECFLKVLLLARELKLLKVGTVSVDGSRLDAAASKHRNVTYERAGELIAQLQGEIEELLQKAEAADQAQEREPGKLPAEIARREKLKAQLAAARPARSAGGGARAERAGRV